LHRIAELFNVNHFIISQARPSIAPMAARSSDGGPRHAHAHRRRNYPARALLRVVGLETQHRLRQLDALGLLPTGVRRFLVDDVVPAACTTLVPEISPADFFGLLERPTRATVAKWIRRGERSVWPAVGALKVRCAVEVELDRAYQVVRRRKPMDAGGAGAEEEGGKVGGPVDRRRRRRVRASSFETGA